MHFADFRTSSYHKRDLLFNFLQAALFLSIHKHHAMSGRPLILVTMLSLALLNGTIFLKTRNISGYILSHSTINGFALFLRRMYVYSATSRARRPSITSSLTTQLLDPVQSAVKLS